MNKPVAWIHETELQDGTTVKRVTGAWELEYRYIVDSCDRGNPIPLYTHPVKELHLSLQKEKETGELLAVTYTDDEHRIVEVLWQRPPVKELTDKEIEEVYEKCEWSSGYVYWKEFAKAILRKASEK